MQTQPNPEQEVERAWNAYLDHGLVVPGLSSQDAERVHAVLDIGSGRASFSRAHFSAVSAFLAADVRMQSGVDLVCDVRALPFRDHAFDLVLCLRVIQHVPEDMAAFRELHRITRRGGRVIVAVGNQRSWTVIEARKDSPRWRRRVPYPYYHPYGAADLAAKMTDVGFSRIGIQSALYLPDAINRLPILLVLALLRLGPGIDRLANAIPGLRMAGTNLVAWGVRT